VRNQITQIDKLQVRNYNIIGNDRDGTTRGGGVAILVQNGIPHVRVRLPDTEFECVAIRLVHNNIFVVSYSACNFLRNSDLNHK
jgi:hypothetical protein